MFESASPSANSKSSDMFFPVQFIAFTHKKYTFDILTNQ